MRFKKWCFFVLVIFCTFFLFSLEVNAAEEFFYSGDINIYFSESTDNEDDNQNVYIELMVLRSDFQDNQVNNVINQDYKNRYPNYENFTHLVNDDEISYFAYIEGAHLYRNKIEFRFVDDHGYYKNITKVRMIIFDSEGEVLASSELFEHVNRTRFFIVNGLYSASYDDLSFSNTRHHAFNWLWIVLWGLIYAISFFILLMKYLLEVVFGVKYKKLFKSLLFDSIVIIFGAYMMHFLNETFIPATSSSVLIMSTSFFIFMIIISLLFLIEKKCRVKYLLSSLILYIVIFFTLDIIVIPFV